MIGKIVAGGIVIVVIALVVWAATSYASTFYAEKKLTLTVTDKFIDREGQSGQYGSTEHTYYLVTGTDSKGAKRVVELRETYGTDNTNIDIQYGEIKVGQTYDIKCIGEENLKAYYYYQCQFPVN